MLSLGKNESGALASLGSLQTISLSSLGNMSSMRENAQWAVRRKHFNNNTLFIYTLPSNSCSSWGQRKLGGTLSPLPGPPSPPPRAFNWLASLLEAWSRPHLRPLPLPTWPGRWRLMRPLPGVKAFSLGSVNPCASLSEWATFCMFSPGSYFSEFLFSEPKLGCMA